MSEELNLLYMLITAQQIAEASRAQRLAAADSSDRVRVVAGPGTGKSHTIEERVCWLLEEGVPPSSIAIVSFTRAASFDLAERIRRATARTKHKDAVIKVTTLHGLALRTLRVAGALSAYPADHRVLDDWEVGNLFDTEFGHASGIQSTVRCRQIREEHEAFWSTGSREERPGQDLPDEPVTDAERRQFLSFHTPRTQLYSCGLPGELVQRCVAAVDAGTLDLSELLGISDLVVDEFQDLNPMDLRFIYGLEAGGTRLFVAGDDDQSLYSFRYAHPEAIQSFTDTERAVGDHVLRDCFRCSPKVLGAAESLITSFATPNRIDKAHQSLLETADPPIPGGCGFWRFDDDADEARALARSCRRLVDAGLPPREIMILLSNTRALTWQLRDALEAEAVPFELPRVEPFTHKTHGRALLALLRVAANPDDCVALRMLLGLRRGTGVATTASIADAALQANLSYRDLFSSRCPWMCSLHAQYVP